MAAYEDELAQIVAQLNRAAPSAASAPGVPPGVSRDAARETKPHAPQVAAPLDSLLLQAAKRGASDLLLIAGAPVTFRITGSLTPATPAPLTAGDTRELLLPLLSPPQVRELEQSRSVDLCFSREGIGRFRANVHYQRGTLSGSFRLLPDKIPTLESLPLPPALKKLAAARQGLLLITGPTGCGKSSTLAAMVDLINSTRQHHVVTLEDPIEYIHSNRSSIVEQIEVGTDARDFASSVRSILRQNPDVILIGEMRDAETIATALTAAETGHLVLSTLHTNDTSQAVSRILDSFPSGNQQQIRQQLSLALLGVVAQQLVPGIAGGRYPAVEILTASSGVRNLIRRGEDHQLYTAISIGRADGMITMEQSLVEMVHMGRISREVARAHCFRTQDFERYLNG